MKAISTWSPPLLRGGAASEQNGVGEEKQRAGRVPEER